MGRQGARPPHRDLVGRAPRGRPHAALPREVRVRDRRAAGRPLRPGRPRPARGGAHRQDDPRLDHARQQRGRHDPADRRDRRARPDAQGRRCSTSTRSRPRRTSTSTSRRSAPTSSRSARTSSRARRASARCTSATGRTSSPSSRAATQERHRRAGTENVAGAVGLATAYELSCAERAETVARLREQRDRLARRPSSRSPGVELTGHPKERLPGLLSIVARDTDGASVAMSLDLEGIACSVGSACTTGSTEVSHVLTAMGYPEEEARGALRLSLGRTTTDDEIATACDVVPRVIASMRLGHGRRRRGPARAGRAGVSRILVAMSGGVDSSVAAALLHEQGHEVVGVWMRLHDVADTLLRVQEELLLARRRRRRAPGRRPARHPVLRHEPRARVRRRRPPAVPRRVPRAARRRRRASTATRT